MKLGSLKNGFPVTLAVILVVFTITSCATAPPRPDQIIPPPQSWIMKVPLCAPILRMGCLRNGWIRP